MDAMERRPSISVIVPVYNVEKYLEQCLDSAVGQTLRNIEIILVDDGSTDRSGEICDAYERRDKRIRTLHKANGGLGSARNAGIRAAAGEYLYFLDSDDYIDANALRELYDIATEHDLDMLLFTGTAFSDPEGAADGVLMDYDSYRHHLNTVTRGVECLEHSLRENEYITSNCMRLFRATLFKGENGLRYCERIIHEDEDVGVISLIRARRVMKLDRPYYHRRYRAGSTMTHRAGDRSAEGYLYAAKRVTEVYDESRSPEERRALTLCLEMYVNSVIELYCVGNRDDRKKIARMFAAFKRETGIRRYPVKRKRVRMGLVSLKICAAVQKCRAVTAGR